METAWSSPPSWSTNSSRSSKSSIDSSHWKTAAIPCRVVARAGTLLRFNQTTPPANPPHSSVQAFVGMRRMLRPYPARLAGRAQLEAFSGESSQGRPTRSNSCRSRGRRRCVSRSSAMSSSTPAASADPVASLRIFANRRAATR
jgi:hypothetical protein